MVTEIFLVFISKAEVMIKKKIALAMHQVQLITRAGRHRRSDTQK